ncbi:hypothetical protein [Streptomyces sp. H51]|uniref:hypothetical protein n=1 Tax=Streptomyces sp. H51 TaxID=3111770 RepID=UPI002D79CE63|nr:hypothetical protein [Streptomyces sp. H51]
MGRFVDASVRFPAVGLTSALVVALGFWALVLLGRADVRAFDTDLPSLTRSLSGIPVAVAVSAVIVSAWLVSLTGTVLMDLAHLTGASGATARVALLAASALAARTVTRRCAPLLAGLFPHPRTHPRTHQPTHPRTATDSAPYDPGSPRSRA